MALGSFLVAVREKMPSFPAYMVYPPGDTACYCGCDQSCVEMASESRNFSAVREVTVITLGSEQKGMGGNIHAPWSHVAMSNLEVQWMHFNTTDCLGYSNQKSHKQINKSAI